MQRGLPEKRPIKDVKKVIAVSSAKGGVGKSTISGVYLRLSLNSFLWLTRTQEAGWEVVSLILIFSDLPYRLCLISKETSQDCQQVRNLDCFLIHGSCPNTKTDNQLIPLTNYGLKSMSMGYLVPQTSAIAWRGLMVMKALQQLLHEVEWGGLDVLVLDLPPGTGDVQLTITQQVELDGML
jgi:ATP-binding protein involved in chromosome partitioning